jgi:hypothetical protein
MIHDRLPGVNVTRHAREEKRTIRGKMVILCSRSIFRLT